MSEKKRLRREYAQIRNLIDKNVRREMSLKIQEILCESQIYADAKVVFVYVSVGVEVETLSLIDKALRDGKRVVVPLSNSETHTMETYEIKSRAQLETGVYNIPEPKRELIIGGEIQKVTSCEIDLAIVPAIVFDKRGMRIGYGGGYYDRFLKDFKGVSVGVAFSQCIAEVLPTEEFDCMVDKIVCPEGMIENGEFIYKR